MERIKGNESLVGLRRVVVAQFAEVMLAKIGVNAILVGAVSELGEVLLYGLRPSKIAEAQTDDTKRIGDTPIVVLIVSLIEVVTDRYLVVEQGGVLLEGLFVEVL